MNTHWVNAKQEDLFLKKKCSDCFLKKLQELVKDRRFKQDTPIVNSID